MLEIHKIRKSYHKEELLKDISLNFSQKEFVYILGPSGSGKTTLLNIIGGLDQADSGELIINGISTKNYRDKDWDNYRNHHIGFIFQNYQLINHLSVYKNIELALIIKGLSKKERKNRVLDIIKKVGLDKLTFKKPNFLSGGERQRVAIARALVNDPDIILCDEPTGALDSKNSEIIMNLIKEIAKDKLVIMVTHNDYLASKYATRVIHLVDGKVIIDTNTNDEKDKSNEFIENKNKKMSFLTTLYLSFTNLLTKKGRTFLVSLAVSMGLIGISLISSISNGFQNYLKKMEQEELVKHPITITKEAISLENVISNIKSNTCNQEICLIDDINNKVISNKPIKNDLISLKNNINLNYHYINNYVRDINYQYSLNIDLYNDGELLDLENNYTDNIFVSINNNAKIFDEEYQVLRGRIPANNHEIVLIINEDKEIPKSILEKLSLKDKYQDIIGKKYQLYLSDGMLHELEIVGVLMRINDLDDPHYLGYHESLLEIVETSELDTINIYPKNYQYKEEIIKILKIYNQEHEDIIYNDYAEILLDNTSKIIDIITYILIAMVLISLIVSSIMITIITYISVLERKEEMGILRSIGASKKDIKRIFNSETIIEGINASIIAIIATLIINYLINKIIYHYTYIREITYLSNKTIILIIIISISLTYISGLIPARIACKKRIADVLRSQ